MRTQLHSVQGSRKLLPCSHAQSVLHSPHPPMDATSSLGSRWLQSLANNIVGAALPKLRTWLRSRLGPDAELESLRLEGGFVVLEQAKIPLGGRAYLQVAHANIQVSSEGLLARGAPQLRLQSLRGEVRVGAKPGAPSFSAPVVFSALPPERALADAWVDGNLAVQGAHWTCSQGVGEQRPLHGTARLTVTMQHWSLEGAKATVGPSRIGLRASGSTVENTGAVRVAEISLEAARAGHLADALVALSGQVLPSAFEFPWHALLHGRGTWSLASGADFDFRAELGSSQLSLRGKSDASEALQDATLRAELRLPDLNALLKLPPALELACAPTALPDETLVCEFALSGRLRSPTLQGQLRLASLPLRVHSARGELPVLHLRALEAQLCATAECLAVETFSVALLNTTLRGSGRVPLARGDQATGLAHARFELQLPESGPASLEALSAYLGTSPRWVQAISESKNSLAYVLPSSLRVMGLLDWQGHDGAALELAFQTDASSALLKLSTQDRETLTGQVKARLAIADLVTMGVFQDRVQLLPTGHCRLSADLDGSVSSPCAVGTLTGEGLVLAVLHSALAPLVLPELRADFLATPEKFVWNDARLRVLSGWLSTAGVLRFRAPAPRLQAKVNLEGLRVEQLGLRAPRAPVRSFVEGSLSGQLRVEAEDLQAETLRGDASLALEVPMFHAFSHFAPQLEQWGFRKLSLLGTGPVRVQATLTPRELLVQSCSASLREGRLSGRASVSRKGSLTGDFELLVHEDFLGSSVLLALPAAIVGELRVPVSLRGTVESPQVEAKLKEALTAAALRNPLGSFVGETVEAGQELLAHMGLRMPPSNGTRQHSVRGPAQPLPTALADILDRLLQGDPETDQLVEQLVHQGYEPAELAALLAERRQQQRKTRR